jgi:hypothetical protein
VPDVLVTPPTNEVNERTDDEERDYQIFLEKARKDEERAERKRLAEIKAARQVNLSPWGGRMWAWRREFEFESRFEAEGRHGKGECWHGKEADAGWYESIFGERTRSEWDNGNELGWMKEDQIGELPLLTEKTIADQGRGNDIFSLRQHTSPTPNSRQPEPEKFATEIENQG